MADTVPSQSERGSVTLHELYRRADAEWQAFRAIPGEEVRAYWKTDPRPEGRVQESFDRQAAIRLQINEHPDCREFEVDLLDALGPRILEDDIARKVYASMTNSMWTHKDGDRFGAGFRGAGGIVAEMRNGLRGDDSEDYMTWYCSSPEGQCSEDIEEALAPYGWTWSEDVA